MPLQSQSLAGQVEQPEMFHPWLLGAPVEFELLLTGAPQLPLKLLNGHARQMLKLHS